MIVYDLLSEPVKRYIRDKGWTQLRPIQAAAVERVIASDGNFILVSGTASGKTEAAFLPILSKVNFNEPGVKVLYISPLIALINDQFARVEDLCRHLDVTVTKWHGEASRGNKEKLIREPNGIVLITPESIEAMFVNKPYNVKRLFSHLHYVVIDEIHAFIGSDRGVQLKSLLSRLQLLQERPFSIIGLSATIGDYEEAKAFTGDPAGTRVLLDKTVREMDVSFRYFEQTGQELPSSLVEDLYKETKDKKALVFPNSRGRAEEVAVKLKKMAEGTKGHLHYYAHHSSVNRQMRESIELFAKANKHRAFCIVCTSTLELGIDIGTVEEVVQIDATHSIASLIQRVGRSGRKEGTRARLLLYSSNPWSLVQSIASWLLYREGFIEPPALQRRPYDVLVHQTLSIVKEQSGIVQSDLVARLVHNPAFSGISSGEMEESIAYLIRCGLLELLQKELIIGVKGEKIVNSRDFYSVFKTEDNFTVTYAGSAIGEVPFSTQIVEGGNLLLSAKIWSITDIDQRTKKIKVLPAKDGKKPIFFGSAGNIHPRVRQKMMEVTFSDCQYEFLDEYSRAALAALRSEFSAFRLKDLNRDRPLLNRNKTVDFFTFNGTKINRTLQLLFSVAGFRTILDDSRSSLLLECNDDELVNCWRSLHRLTGNIDQHIMSTLAANPAVLDFSKWGRFLPRHLQVELLKDRYYAIEETQSFVEGIRLIGNA